MRNIILIILVALVGRILFYVKNLGNTFPSSWVPMPLQPDGFFHYYNNPIVPKFIIFLLPLLATIGGLIILYKLLKELKIKNPVIVTCLFSLFHPFLIQTYLGYTDTPAIIWFAVMAIIATLNNRYFFGRFTPFILFFIILITTLIWNAFIQITIVIILLYFYGILIEKKKYKYLILLGLLSGVFLVIPISNIFNYLVIMNSIRELQPNLSVIFLIVFVLMLALIFDNLKRHNRYTNFILLAASGSALLSFLQQRWTYIGITFMVLAILIIKESYKERIIRRGIISILIAIFITGLVMSSVTFYKAEPLIYEEEMNAIGKLDATIIGSWGMGHVYQSFSDKKVLYKGHPHENSIYWDFVVKNNISDHWVIRGDCYIIINHLEIEKYNTTLDLPLMYDGIYRIYECDRK